MGSRQNSATSRIQVLPPFVAERIAAGEVIERPASVVKELVENSLDAGATEVSVILEDGGKGLIEVIDNGHGMTPEELSLCVRRHATSKLRSLDDLEKIRTLGFRGEALPSIGAVADVSILSRAVESASGSAYELAVDSSKSDAIPEAVTFGHFLGSPHGTCIRARGLFSQVPARLKFLKSQAAEVAQVREWLERLALAHPQTGFRLISNDRTLLSLRPQDEISRVRAILSDDEDYPILTAHTPAHTEDDSTSEISVRVHWLQGLSTPQTRKLAQVVNGRSLRDRLLQQALLTPFRQALLPGQFPALALYITVPTGDIDVNVHPTKTEIRFLDSRKVFRAVQSLVESLIARAGAPAYAAGALGTMNAAEPNAWKPEPAPAAVGRPTPGWTERTTPTWRASEPAQRGWDFTTPPVVSSASASPTAEFAEDMRSENTQTPATLAVSHPFQSARLTGILFNTYLVYDLGTEAALVDQHAAHERIRYEKIKRRALGASGTPGAPQPSAPRQALLLPEAVRFAPESRTELESRLQWLEKLGFEVEIFGEDTLLFRSIPAEWGTDSLRPRLKNLVERVLAVESTAAAPKAAADPDPSDLLMDESLFETLASEACHSAVRAGDRLDPLAAESLVNDLFRCEHPWNCPHGRPTVARVPRGRFEEWFQRRV